MASQRPIILLAMAALPVIGAAPAFAQADDKAVLEKLRACAKMEDAARRTACYDASLGRQAPAAASSAPQPRTEPGRAQRAEPRPAGFGSETVRAARQPRPQEAEQIRARVSAIAERQPGIYRLTLDDGAQWQFESSAPFSYQPPSPGATVAIRRGAVGSFLLRYQGQPSVRVLRIR